MYIKSLLVFNLFLVYTSSYEVRKLIGTPCHEGNFTGVCKKILECPYAIKVVNDDKRKVNLCGYDESGDPTPCCPTQNLLYRTGIFKEFFKASSEGVLRTSNMTCRYEGRQPFLCCQNIPEIDDPPEPEQCPPLPKPKLGAKDHFLWSKCVSYQRYFNKCVVSQDNPNTYVRHNSCGIPKNSLRISGGEPALPRQFPHMAVVGCHNTVSKKDADIIWVGGGSLISEKFILTASHVLVESEFGKIRYALMGTLDKQDTKSGMLYNVIRTIAHKLYSMQEKLHDIALLELHERVKFNEFIRPACLPLEGQETDDVLIIAGWGETDEKGKPTDVLLTTTVTENKYTCMAKFNDKTFYPDSMICGVGTLNNASTSRDSCRGDSGGPLMALLKNIKCSYAIQGVVSYGPRCGQNAGVYTRVSVYLDWIMENVWPKEYAKLKLLRSIPRLG